MVVAPERTCAVPKANVLSPLFGVRPDDVTPEDTVASIIAGIPLPLQRLPSASARPS